MQSNMTPRTRIPMSKGHFRDLPECAWSLVLFPVFENSEIKNIITVSEAFMSRCQLNKAFALYDFTQQCLTQGIYVPCIHREGGVREEENKHGHLEDAELGLWRTYREAVGGRQRKGAPEETSWRSRGVRPNDERWGYCWELEIISEVPSYMATLSCGKSGPDRRSSICFKTVLCLWQDFIL